MAESVGVCARYGGGNMHAHAYIIIMIFSSRVKVVHAVLCCTMVPSIDCTSRRDNVALIITKMKHCNRDSSSLSCV